MSDEEIEKEFQQWLMQRLPYARKPYNPRVELFVHGASEGFRQGYKIGYLSALINEREQNDRTGQISETLSNDEKNDSSGPR